MLVRLEVHDPASALAYRAFVFMRTIEEHYQICDKTQLRMVCSRHS